jgi:hypothetical protein
MCRRKYGVRLGYVGVYCVPVQLGCFDCDGVGVCCVFLEGWQGKNGYDSAWRCCGCVRGGVFGVANVVFAYSLRLLPLCLKLFGCRGCAEVNDVSVADEQACFNYAWNHLQLVVQYGWVVDVAEGCVDDGVAVVADGWA